MVALVWLGAHVVRLPQRPVARPARLTKRDGNGDTQPVIPWDAVLYPVLFGVPGAMIARQLPRHPVGWLMLAIGGCFAVNAVSLLLIESGRENRALTWWSERGSAIVVPLTLLLVLLLPDGRLPSPRWRPVVVGVVAAQLAVVVIWCLVPVLPESWGEVLRPAGAVARAPLPAGDRGGGPAAAHPERPPADGQRARRRPGVRARGDRARPRLAGRRPSGSTSRAPRSSAAASSAPCCAAGSTACRSSSRTRWSTAC